MVKMSLQQGKMQHPWNAERLFAATTYPCFMGEDADLTQKVYVEEGMKATFSREGRYEEVLVLLINGFPVYTDDPHLSQFGLHRVKPDAIPLGALLDVYKEKFRDRNDKRVIFNGNRLQLGTTCNARSGFLADLTHVKFVNVQSLEFLDLTDTAIVEFVAAECSNLRAVLLGRTCTSALVFACETLLYVAAPPNVDASNIITAVACEELRAIFSSKKIKVAYCPLFWLHQVALPKNIEIGKCCSNAVPPPGAMEHERYYISPNCPENLASDEQAMLYFRNHKFGVPLSDSFQFPASVRNLDRSACLFQTSLDSNTIYAHSSLPKWEKYMQELCDRAELEAKWIPPSFRDLYRYIVTYECEEFNIYNHGLSDPPEDAERIHGTRIPSSGSKRQQAAAAAEQRTSPDMDALAVAAESMWTLSDMPQLSEGDGGSMAGIDFEWPKVVEHSGAHGCALYVDFVDNRRHFVIRATNCDKTHDFCNPTDGNRRGEFGSLLQAIDRMTQEISNCFSIHSIHFIGNLPMGPITSLLRNGSLLHRINVFSIAYNFYPVSIEHDFEMIDRLLLLHCPNLRYVRPGIECHCLLVQTCHNLVTVNMPNRFNVEESLLASDPPVDTGYNFVAVDCPQLTMLVCNGKIYLQDCQSLSRLPRELTLDAAISVGPGCSQLSVPSSTAITSRYRFLPELSLPDAADLYRPVENNAGFLYFQTSRNRRQWYDTTMLQAEALAFPRPLREFTLCPFQRICCVIGSPLQDARLARAVSRDHMFTAIAAARRRGYTYILPNEMWLLIAELLGATIGNP
jgi:hypothetical protein